MESEREPVLDFAGVGVWRRVDGGRKDLLAGIDWRVERGERWGVVGPNGAGKSTLLRIASAQLRPTLGTATILGGRLGRVAMHELRRRIGFVEASFGRRFHPEQTVREVVLTGRAGTILLVEEPGAEGRETCEELLGLVGATELADRSFLTCSEGERARILLARSLMADAPLVILDEPAAGLDLPGRELLLAVIGDVVRERPGLTTVTVSHHLEELPAATTHLLLLRDGGVVAGGPVAEVATAELLGACFGMELDVERSGGRIFATAARASLRPA